MNSQDHLLEIASIVANVLGKEEEVDAAKAVEWTTELAWKYKVLTLLVKGKKG